MIFDISQEVFSAEVYLGDPIPKQTRIKNIDENSYCQLTEFSLGSHTGTHIDAPCHFIVNGKDVQQIDLEKCIGKCLVIEKSNITLDTAEVWKKKGIKKILLKGNEKLSTIEADCFIKANIECIGVECATVGKASENEEVHLMLLSSEIVILEGLRLKDVPAGEYFLIALPLKMKGLDGSPVRAILAEINEKDRK